MAVLVFWRFLNLRRNVYSRTASLKLFRCLAKNQQDTSEYNCFAGIQVRQFSFWPYSWLYDKASIGEDEVLLNSYDHYTGNLLLSKEIAPALFEKS
jgi:hypothetical protein